MKHNALLILVIALFIVTASFTKVHKYYVSVTQIEYSESKKNLEIIMRVFADDLEALLRERYDDKVRIPAMDQAGSDLNSSFIQSYLQAKLIVHCYQERQIPEFIGYKIEDDMVVIFLEIKSVNELKSLQVENRVLMDLYQEQKNVVHLKSGKERRSIILDYERPNGVLKF